MCDIISRLPLKNKQTKKNGHHDPSELFAEVCCYTDIEVWHPSWTDGPFKYRVLLDVSSRNTASW